jgi:hypothetical protein
MSSNLLNMTHSEIDGSPAPYVIRRSTRNTVGMVFSPMKHADFEPPPSPARKKRDSQAKLADNHGVVQSSSSSHPISYRSFPSHTSNEDEATPTRKSSSPSEVTEEREGPCATEGEYLESSNDESIDDDFIGNWVNQDVRPMIHRAVHVHDDCDSEGGVLTAEVTSMSPLPFDVADDGVGSLVGYLLQPEELLSLSTDSA